MAPAQWKSNRPAVERLWLRATDKALNAAALLYAGAVVERLRNGYTSGAFVQGNVAGSVTIGTPEWRDGKRWIAIGTNFEYALYWELGHLSLWTADYEHVPVWVPLFEELAPQMRDMFVSTFKKEWEAGGGAPL
jgi:hypothetical protein